jgi:pyruvate dehydrogenase E1 component beta subunit
MNQTVKIETPKVKMNVIQAINAALDDAMAADENVFLLGEDIGDREEGGVCAVTKGLSTKYG